MTKEQTAVEWIADRFRQYQKEGYKSNWDEIIQIVLLAKEIEDKELSKEREKAKKLVEALGSAISTLEGLEMYNTCETIKQSLTEYSQVNELTINDSKDGSPGSDKE
jgi:hypothetical protein